MKVLRDYEGREVRLIDERLTHILEHPEMVGLVKVVGADAFVLTAYLTDTIKKGQQLWPPRA